jgi:hypothetical protein
LEGFEAFPVNFPWFLLIRSFTKKPAKPAKPAFWMFIKPREGGYRNKMSTENTPYIPHPPGPLTTLGHVRTELAKVYRDTRLRKIPTAEGTRLAYILMMIGRIIEGNEMEKRLEALEQATNMEGRMIRYVETVPFTEIGTAIAKPELQPECDV